jgi:hypothetical protein
VAGSVAAERLAEIQAQFPAVPIVFCETRPLAEQWTYRWLGACQYELELVAGTSALEESFSRALEAYATATPIRPKPAAIRAWARQAGLAVAEKGPNSTPDPGGLGRSPSSALVPHHAAGKSHRACGGLVVPGQHRHTTVQDRGVSDRQLSSPCALSYRRPGAPPRSCCQSRLSLPAGPVGRPRGRGREPLSPHCSAAATTVQTGPPCKDPPSLARFPAGCSVSSDPAQPAPHVVLQPMALRSLVEGPQQIPGNVAV